MKGRGEGGREGETNDGQNERGITPTNNTATSSEKIVYRYSIHGWS